MRPKKPVLLLYIYSDNMNNTKNAFRNSEIIKYLFWKYTRAKGIERTLL